MNKSTPASLLALAALALCDGASAADLTPSAVLSGANQYNGQDISVTGTITLLKTKTSNDGKPFVTFKLCDANACLDALAWGTSTYTEGAQLTASGHFWMF